MDVISELNYKESKEAVNHYLIPIRVLSRRLQANFQYRDGLVVADDLIRKLEQLSQASQEMIAIIKLEELISYVELFLMSINELEPEAVMILYYTIFGAKSDVMLADELSSNDEQLSRNTINRRKQNAYKKLWHMIEFNKQLHVV